MENAAIGAKLEDYHDKTATDYPKSCQRAYKILNVQENKKKYVKHETLKLIAIVLQEESVV